MAISDFWLPVRLRPSSWNLLLMLLSLSSASGQLLEYKAPPLDNPLKGFVPYAGADNHRFPHSLEFRYFALKDILVGESAEGDFQFDWSCVEEFLNEVKSRGHQGVFRIHCEYPRKAADVRIDIPQFLVDRGVKVTKVCSTKDVDPAGSPTHCSMSPDYGNPLFRQALVETITAMGRKYDGDLRIGFLELGTLGFWGEWHTYPEIQHMASRNVQDEVLHSFEDAFKLTKLLVRYPEGDTQNGVAANANLNMGYHDDSFTWSTLFRRDAGWHFLTRMAKSKASEKWKANPIGGELYPQLNASVFEDVSKHNGRVASDFVRTVEDTHASYIRLWAVFEHGLSNCRRVQAESAVRRMGYDLHFNQASVTQWQGELNVTAVLENRGVAPFYYNWPVFVGLLNSNGETIEEWPVNWRIDGLVSGENRKFQATFIPSQTVPADAHFAVRVPNPMQGGRSLRFSNGGQQLGGQDWMVLSQINLPGDVSSGSRQDFRPGFKSPSETLDELRDKKGEAAVASTKDGSPDSQKKHLPLDHETAFNLE